MPSDAESQILNEYAQSVRSTTPRQPVPGSFAESIAPASTTAVPSRAESTHTARMYPAISEVAQVPSAPLIPFPMPRPPPRVPSSQGDFGQTRSILDEPESSSSRNLPPEPPQPLGTIISSGETSPPEGQRPRRGRRRGRRRSGITLPPEQSGVPQLSPQRPSTIFNRDIDLQNNRMMEMGLEMSRLQRTIADLEARLEARTHASVSPRSVHARIIPTIEHDMPRRSPHQPSRQPPLRPFSQRESAYGASAHVNMAGTRFVTVPPDPISHFRTPGALHNPTPVPPESQRSVIKIDNPPAFTGGKEGPKIEDWIHLTLDRMHSHSYSFPTEETKFVWLKSLISGDALSVIRPFLEIDNPDRFTTYEEIYAYFQDIYADPTEADRARDKLYRLKQNTASFFEYCNVFIQLATKCGLARSEWKKELELHMNHDLRRAVNDQFLDPTYSFTKFRQFCMLKDQSLRQIERSERADRALRPTPRAAAPRASAPRSGPVRSAYLSQAAASTPRAAPAARTSAAGASGAPCYNCGQPGHFASACTRPRKATVAYVDAHEDEPEYASEGDDSREEPQSKDDVAEEAATSGKE